MTFKIAIITGLILACTSVPRTRGDPQIGHSLYDPVIPAGTEIYPGAASNNDGMFLVPTDPAASAWTEASSIADGIDQWSASNEYPLLRLPKEEAMIFTDSEQQEPGDMYTGEKETALLGNITESELRHWLEEAVSSSDETAAEAGNSNLVQVIFIEPPDVPEIDASDDILIPDDEYYIIHAPPEWYEWLHPRMFISKWADFWMTETNATPVVLVLIKF